MRPSLPAGGPPATELRRYQVRLLSHTGRTLRREVLTFHGPFKAVALACEQIHGQLGSTDASVRSAEVSVEDLGLAKRTADGLYDLSCGLHDRHEF